MYMKLSKILMFAALFALTACGGGKGAEVDEAKAKEVAKNISTETKAVKNLDFEMELITTDVDKNVDKSTYSYKLSENGDLFAGATGSSKDGNANSQLYRVKNDEYEEVLYYHTFNHDAKTNKDDESTVCYGKKGNETVYTTMSASIGTAAIMSVEMVYSSVADPSVVLAEAAKDQSYDVKYYSSGDKNLTIELKFNGQKGSSDADEDPIKSATATYTYSNGLLAKFEASSEYDSGEKMTQKAEAKYSNVKISLPDGWKDLVNKATISF